MNKLTGLIELHPSASDRFMVCAHSIIPPEIPIRETGDAGNLGSAVHAGIANYIQVIEYDLTELSARFSVKDNDTLQKYIAFAAKGWRDSISQYFPNPLVEKSLETTLFMSNDLQIKITGTLDVADVSEPVILDWKSGQVERSYYHQMLEYAILAFNNYYRDSDAIHCYIADIPRYQVKEPYIFNRQMCGEFVEKVVDRIKNLDKLPYEVGEHCHFCPRRHECDAHAIQLRSSISALMDGVGVDYSALEAAGELDAFYDRLKIVENACSQMRDGLKLYLNVRNGEIVTEQGTFKLTNVERKELDPQKSWDTLTQHLTQDEIASCSKISLPHALKLISSKAERGQGAEMKRQVTEDLDEANAIVRSGFTKMDYRKNK